jgi:tryptophan synthase alpha chain
MKRTIAQSFAQIPKSTTGPRAIGLMPFVPAGYPDLQTTVEVIKAMDAAGATASEIGFPFSDPIADGPTIQAAFTEALAKKIKVADIFAMVKQVSPSIATPMVAMVSYSIVFRYGPERFFADARASGFSGLLIPDLPPPEAQPLCVKVRAAGLDTVLLVAPTTTPARRKEIAGLCSGFVYYLSVSGITGARAELPPDLVENVRQLKTLTEKPVCVGFGISTPQHVADLAKVADGAIVGSAIVKLMTEKKGEGVAGVAKAVGEYCRLLLNP